MMEENYYPIEFDNTGASFVINNNGTAPAPCVVSFIPKVDFIVFEIRGLSREPIKVPNIRTGQTLIIDGENRTVKLDDKDILDKYEAWEFPKLQPGENTITVINGIQASISIEYNARYI